MELKLKGEKHNLVHVESAKEPFTTKVMSTLLGRKFRKSTIDTYRLQTL